MNIFISYNRQTKAVTKALVDDLEALGHTVWFDQELSGGQAWWDQILSMIRRCDLFVFVLDPASLNSIACRREYGYAADLRKPILPILVSEGVSTNLLPPSLSQIEFVDYRNQDSTAALRFARALSTVPPPAALPDPLPNPPEAPLSYLGSLAAKVEATSLLPYEEQTGLLFDLKRGLRDPETADDARTLLKIFRKRRDLLAGITEEIDELLEGLITPSARGAPGGASYSGRPPVTMPAQAASSPEAEYSLGGPPISKSGTRIPKRIGSAIKTLIEKPKKLLIDLSESLRRSEHMPSELRPTRKPEKVVNTGFADRSRPEKPLDKYIPLASSTSYYFWLEVAEVIQESIEVTPITLPTLPKEARLTVTLFSFENELEVLKTEQTGELRIQADGQVMVSRPAEIPDGLENDLLARRLFFETKTPPRGGSFRLRCNIYCEQVLLQSRLVTARVQNAPRYRMRQIVKRLMPKSKSRGELALESVVDYILSRALDPAQLAELAPNRLSIMLNDNGDGTQGFRFFGYDGKVYFKDDASIDKATLKQLVAIPRHGLNTVSWGTPEDWDGRRAYSYEDGAVDYKRLTNDLATLAVKGFRVYTKLVEALGRKNWMALGELTRRSGTLQISLKESANSVFPAALIYDYNLDSDVFPVAEGKYTLCQMFEAALKSNDPLENCACFHGNCPVKAEIDSILKKGGLINEMGPVICPSGFWGYRHAIGLPISVKDAPDAPTQISFKKAPAMAIGIATTLTGWPEHKRNLLKLDPDLELRIYSTRDDVVKMLKASGSHLIYFYCHGGVNQESVPFLSVGSEEANISPDIFFAQAISWKDPRPLVFINGCHTTAITPDIALQFVNPLVQQADAAGVIGTEITVFEPLASKFAEECLQRFFAGDSIGDAVRGARLTLLKQGNPLGLAYVPFVLPSLRLRQRPELGHTFADGRCSRCGCSEIAAEHFDWECK